MKKHLKLYNELFPQVEKLCESVRANGGNIVLEWRAYNDYWKRKEVIELIRKFELYDVQFDGCALGLKSRDGSPVKKPWRIVTDMPSVADALRPCKCTHTAKEHASCNAAEAKRSANYTMTLAKKFHRAFLKHIILKNYSCVPSVAGANAPTSGGARNDSSPGAARTTLTQSSARDKKVKWLCKDCACCPTSEQEAFVKERDSRDPKGDLDSLPDSLSLLKFEISQ